MRGKALLRIGSPVKLGITPAYAGKRGGYASVTFAKWDHPRLCGEKFFIVRSAFRAPGSPPPMRGKAFKAFFRQPETGITPAYAGKSKIEMGRNSCC